MLGYSPIEEPAPGIPDPGSRNEDLGSCYGSWRMVSAGWVEACNLIDVRAGGRGGHVTLLMPGLRVCVGAGHITDS